LGVEHLIFGIDHVLFVLVLLYVVHGWKNLFKVITSFTVAHSVTLGLSSLELLTLAQAPVEALIGLSIVFLAAEALRGKYMQENIEPQFNTIWAITDFTEENGATQVVPGSTTWPDDRKAKPEEICQATMSAGSVLLYSGSVFHSGGENKSSSDRIGANLTYTLGWLRQEENQYLSCPPELVREYPTELQDMLGYTMGQYAMGYYTPPELPGKQPECVSPAFAVREVDSAALGGEELLDATK
ncbi:HupE/UreJ family protein, partial [Pseudomonadales bacterium]|nr:HupE/UreJ family protein [Pseudomonadales bacterium]